MSKHSSKKKKDKKEFDGATEQKKNVHFMIQDCNE